MHLGLSTYSSNPTHLKDPIKPKPEINQTNYCNSQRWFFTKKIWQPPVEWHVFFARKSDYKWSDRLPPLDFAIFCQYVGFSLKCDENSIKPSEISTKFDKILTERARANMSRSWPDLVRSWPKCNEIHQISTRNYCSTIIDGISTRPSDFNQFDCRNSEVMAVLDPYTHNWRQVVLFQTLIDWIEW